MRKGSLTSRALVPLTGLALMALTACHSGSHPDLENQSIRDAEAAEQQAWMSKDPDKIVSFYADDAVMMNPGAKALTSKHQIRDYLKKLFADEAFDRQTKLETADVAESGDLGYTAGSYFAISTDPSTKLVVRDEGKWLTIRKKQQDGSWKIVREMYNTDLPPPSGSDTKPPSAPPLPAAK